MRAIERLIPLLIALAVLVSPAPLGALEFPPLSGRVVDEANVLDAAAETALTEKLAALEAKSTDQLVVVTLRSLRGTTIEDYGYQLGRHWKVGQKDKNNGAILIVAPSERRVRIEVGYGLEGSLTDAVTRLIIANSIAPRFRANDIPGGIARGVDDIIQVLSGDAEEWNRRAAARPDQVHNAVDVGTVVLLAIIVLVVLMSLRGGGGPGGGFGPRGRRRGGWAPIFIPTGGWSSGSGSSGWGSGGGFSGGGGSFGGGGSSGSW